MSFTLYSWGANGHGQLGLGHNRENEANVPTKVQVNIDLQEISQVVAGGSHSILVTCDGNIFGCGNNSKHQLGFYDANDILYFTQLNLNLKVKQVACGWEHTVTISDNGEVYSWGANNFNQLGINSNQKQIQTPVKVEIQCQIIDISAGIRHSLAVTENGQIFSWGDNKKGQLGRRDECKLPRKICYSSEQVIKNVICGSYHSAAINDSGDILLWGCNDYGQLAINPSEMTVIPIPMLLSREIFNNEGISCLRSGWTHFVATTNNGSIYSWGRNDYGQLGRNIEKKIDFIPLKLTDIHSPTLLFSGSHHNTAILNDQNESSIITWGWNEHGICGNGTEENVMQPTRLNNCKLEKFRVINGGCGSGQNFIVVESGYGAIGET